MAALEAVLVAWLVELDAVLVDWLVAALDDAVAAWLVVLVVAALVTWVAALDETEVALVVASLAAELVATLALEAVLAAEDDVVVAFVASACTFVLLRTEPPKNEKKVNPATSQSFPDL